MGLGDTETQRITGVFSVPLSLCGKIPLCLAGHLDFHHGLPEDACIPSSKAWT